MKLKLSLFSVILAFLFLGDPSSSSCGGCEDYVSRVGLLPDTTLSLNTIWKVNIREELYSGSSYCEAFDSEIFTPKLFLEYSSNIITAVQSGDTLYISSLKVGSTELLITASGYETVDPEILNQHLTISVN